MQIAQNLIEEFGKGHGVLFVGAGLSKGAGLPDWKALMRPLAQELGCSPDLDPTKIAQYYQNKHGGSGRNLLVQHVKRALTQPGIRPSHNHQLLAQLPAPIIFTTNYDDLLERALSQRGVNRIVRDKNIGYWDDEALTLVKMHGSLDDEETLVITSDDYAAYFRVHPNITRQLSALLMTRTFLFLGYSLSDPDFWLVYHQIRFDLAEHKRPAYAVLLNGDPLQAEDLTRSGMEVINLTGPPGGDFNAALGDWIAELLRRLPAPKPKVVAPPAPITPANALADRVENLLRATGYEILARTQPAAQRVRLTVCTERGGPREKKILVVCREGDIEVADVHALDAALNETGAANGYLVSQAQVPNAARRASEATNTRVVALTLDAFYRELADFAAYVRFLIQEWESAELSRWYVDLGGERPHFDQTTGRELSRDTEKPIDGYLDRWLDIPGGNHISILGDYGTGKTTLARQYAYKLARRYLASPEKGRIPIFISLRAYAKAMNLRQLITDFLVNEQRDRVRLTGGYAAFEQLNRDGQFVLIFDGFDEMARQVSYQTTVDNFNELAKAAEGRAKVLLTCRTHYFRETREARRVLAGEETSPLHGSLLKRGGGGEAGEVKEQPAIDLSQRPGFQIVYLDPFTPDDITTLLQKRFPAKWQEYDARIRNTYNLADLAKRPVLLDMIVQTLGEWGAEKITNAAQLYRVCTEEWMERDIRTGRTFMTQDDKRLFSEELATQVFRTGQLQGVHYSEFPAIVTRHFHLEKSDEVDYFAQDILTHSFLIRDDDGKYRFAHNSFMEFLVAQKLWRGLNAGNADEMPVSEEIRAFICGLCDGKLPAVAAPRQIPQGMVYVPPGPFVMGGEVFDDEKPTRIAVVRQGFFIDQDPVTHAQYKKFVDATRHRVPFADTDWARPYNWDKKTRTYPAGLDNHPVVLVSWDDAAAYAKWAGKRLPTEAEWEKAARGIDGRVYPWGDQWDRTKCNSASWWLDEDVKDYAEWKQKFEPRWEKEWIGKKIMTTPVGQFENGASPYGCFDMVGNVWEWTADWYNDEKKTRALRGGSWSYQQDNVRGAVRYNGNPDSLYKKSSVFVVPSSFPYAVQF